MVNMKILDLPLKAKWYEMIESGNKKEEYREIKKYWIGRLANVEVAIPMKRQVSIVRKVFVFLVLHVETAFTPKNTLMFASVLATPNGQCFLNLNL